MSKDTSKQTARMKLPPSPERFKYRNTSHERLLSAIEKAGIKLRIPIMITADQFTEQWSVSVGFMSTGIKIPKADLDLEELAMVTDDDLGGKIDINSVWKFIG